MRQLYEKSGRFGGGHGCPSGGDGGRRGIGERGGHIKACGRVKQ